MVYIVNVLEINNNNEPTTNILSSHIIKANKEIEATTKALKQWKKHPKFNLYRHNYFLRIHA